PPMRGLEARTDDAQDPPHRPLALPTERRPEATHARTGVQVQQARPCPPPARVMVARLPIVHSHPPEPEEDFAHPGEIAGGTWPLLQGEHGGVTRTRLIRRRSATLVDGTSGTCSP